MPTDLEHDEETDTEEDESKLIRDLRRKVKDYDKLQEEVTRLQRAGALQEAGLGFLSEAQRKALLAVHDGEISAEALKITANSLGFANSEDSESGPTVPEAERQAQKRTEDATSAPPQTQVDWNARLAAAQTQDEAMAIIREAEAVGALRGVDEVTRT